MREALPPTLSRARKRIAALTAAAAGAALLIPPGSASAQQEEIDCSTLGDNPMATTIEAAFDTAVVCGVEVRIRKRSWPHLTYSVTPERQLHVTATAAPTQEHYDEGTVDATLGEWSEYLTQTDTPWHFYLRYGNPDDPLVTSPAGTIDWNGTTPVPTYSGTTAVYDELAAGLDLTVDVGPASASLAFTADDGESWNALTSGLSARTSESGGVADGAIVFHRSDFVFRLSDRTTPFTVRDADGAVSPVALALGADDALTISAPEGFLDTAVFPLTLSTQWSIGDFTINEWTAVTSASPDLGIYRGEAGLDLPYFEAAGEQGTAVIGEYCDLLTRADCAETSRGAAYWDFQWPVTGYDSLPDYRHDFSFPVTSATFQVQAAEGTACTLPELDLIDGFTPAVTWNRRPGTTAAAGSGFCQDGTAYYDVTESVPEDWVDSEADSRVTFGMTDSAETARFDGGSARLDVYFDIIGVSITELCSTNPDDPDFYSATQDYGHIWADTWEPERHDLGLTFTTTFYDSDTGAAVLTTDPREMTVGGTSTGTLSPADALENGRYEVVSTVSSETTAFAYTTEPCYIGIDRSPPGFVDITVESGPHHVGDLVSIDVTVADEGFPDGANELSVWIHRASDFEVLDKAILRTETTATFEVQLTGDSNRYFLQIEDQVPNETISEPLTIPAVYGHHDYDRDGHEDLLAVRKADGHLMFHAGLGDGTYEAGVSVGSGWGGMDVVMAGDLTGDDVPDLLARDTATGYLYTYPGDGRGGYIHADRIRAGHSWNTMSAFTSAGDFDMDGHFDLLAIRKADGDLYFYPGAGDGTFGSRSVIDTGWGGFDTITTVRSLDGDQLFDVLARDGYSGEYYMYYGRHDATLWHYGYPVPASLVDDSVTRRYDQVVSAGDLDEDGYDDLVAVDSVTGELVRHSFDDNGAPLHSGEVIDSDWGAMRLPVTAADGGYDYDSDGDGDVIARRAADGNLYFYPGDGEGDLGSRWLMGPGWDSMNLIATAGDLDGDGHADLLARHASTGVMYAYPGTGGGDYSYSGRITIGPGWNGMSTVVGGHDHDSDGFVDVLAVERSTGYLWFYPGTGDGKLGQRQRVGTGWDAMREVTAVGDLDHDGRADLIAVRESSGCLYFYAGRGDGDFERGVSMGCGWNSMDALTGVGDLDGDGHADWLARRISDGDLYLYAGNGTGDYDFSDRAHIGTNWDTIDAIA